MTKPQKRKASEAIRITAHIDRPLTERIAAVNRGLLDQVKRDDRCRLDKIARAGDQLVYEYAWMEGEI